MTAAITPTSASSNGATSASPNGATENGASTTGASVVENPEKKGIFAQFMDDPTELPATVAQQLFSIVPGIAGGFAGFILAARLADTKRVKTKGVLIASALNAILTVATIFLIVAAEEKDIVKEEAETEGA